MPHIRVLFVESEVMKSFLRENKEGIRKAVARCTGYSLGEIALIPDMIPVSIADLADNLLPLEFTIDAGTKCQGQTEHINARLQRQVLADVLGLKAINFGIWLRTMVDNNFLEHKPN